MNGMAIGVVHPYARIRDDDEMESAVENGRDHDDPTITILA